VAAPGAMPNSWTQSAIPLMSDTLNSRNGLVATSILTSLITRNSPRTSQRWRSSGREPRPHDALAARSHAGYRSHPPPCDPDRTCQLQIPRPWAYAYLEDDRHGAGLGSSEVWIDESVATALRRLDDRDLVPRGPFGHPTLKLVGDVAQDRPRHRIGLSVRIEEADDPLRLLKRLNQPIEQIVGGPKLRLNPASAQAIGLALHELATNAAKYGALSKDTGQVEIGWGTDGDIFTMSWAEHDGPPVSLPQRRGFGTIVMKEMAERSVDGRVDLEHAPSGVKWLLTCPAANALEPWRAS
jgi:hypothetical protein